MAWSLGFCWGIWTVKPFSSWVHFTFPLKPNSSTFFTLKGATVLFVDKAFTTASFSGYPITNAYRVEPFVVKRTSWAVRSRRPFSLNPAPRPLAGGAEATGPSPNAFHGRVA